MVVTNIRYGNPAPRLGFVRLINKWCLLSHTIDDSGPEEDSFVLMITMIRIKMMTMMMVIVVVVTMMTMMMVVVMTMLAMRLQVTEHPRPSFVCL